MLDKIVFRQSGFFYFFSKACFFDIILPMSPQVLKSTFSTDSWWSFKELCFRKDILLVFSITVELWSLELACLEHQGSLELVRRSLQFPYTFNVKLHPRVEQGWLELSNSKHGPQGDFSCKNAMMARTKYSLHESVTRLIKFIIIFISAP